MSDELRETIRQLRDSLTETRDLLKKRLAFDEMMGRRQEEPWEVVKCASDLLKKINDQLAVPATGDLDALRYQDALREIDQLCEKELSDPHNDFGDVGDTLERCQRLAREVFKNGEPTGDTEAVHRRALEIMTRNKAP